jgi:hypothetical protein
MVEREKVYIFWDNSNIFIPAQEVSNRKDGIGTGREIRVQFDHLFDLAKAGRDVVQGVCVGSVPPELEHVWRRLRATGVVVEQKWLRLFEQLSPIYKWIPGGLATVQSCPRRRASLATNAKPRWATRGAPRYSS